LQLSHYFLFSL